MGLDPFGLVAGKGFEFGGQVAACVAGVDDAARLNQQHGGLRLGARAVLYPGRHDVERGNPESTTSTTSAPTPARSPTW